MPLVDHVTGLRFEYFGLAEPPGVIDDGDAAPAADVVRAPAAAGWRRRRARRVAARRELPVRPHRAARRFPVRRPCPSRRAAWRDCQLASSQTAHGAPTKPRPTDMTQTCFASASCASPSASRRSRRPCADWTPGGSLSQAPPARPRASCRISRCASMRHFGTDRGAALLTALIVMAIVAAMGLGLALTTTPRTPGSGELRGEPLGAAGGRGRRGDRGPRTGGRGRLEPRARRPGGHLPRSNRATSSSTCLTGPVAGLEELTARATCGRPGACSDSERSAFTAAQALGPEQPPVEGVRARPAGPPDSARARVCRRLWSWCGSATTRPTSMATRWPTAASAPGGEWRPGGCVLAVRAEAFGPRFAHRTVVATVARPAPGCGPGARLVLPEGIDLTARSLKSVQGTADTTRSRGSVPSASGVPVAMTKNKTARVVLIAAVAIVCVGPVGRAPSRLATWPARKPHGGRP